MPNYNQPPAPTEPFLDPYSEEEQLAAESLRQKILYPERNINVFHRTTPQSIIHEPTKDDIHDIAEAGRRVVDDKNNQAQAA